jgi:hypothetical protein
LTPVAAALRLGELPLDLSIEATRFESLAVAGGDRILR